MSIRKYIVLGLSMILVVSSFLFLSDDKNLESDYTGIVSDINQSSNGYIFILNTEDSKIKCFYTISPEYLKYYGIIGDFSDDRSIFFVERMILLE